jgi:glyoxylase-like metal-dependent hydrolase (beta-lactamase superfamily II)
MFRALTVAALLLTAWTTTAQTPPLRTGTLPRQWRAAGPRCTEVPDFEIREYNDDFVILRQSGCTEAEKPFLFLLFGTSKALLLDSGAGNVDVATPVRKLLAAHQARTGGPALPLVVAHSHGHGDHTAGDVELAKLPATTVVAPRVDAVKTFFSITNWPAQTVTFDLGGRVLDIVPIPGHEPSSIAVYDRQTGILLTGDTLYPGRLYVADQAAYAQSIARVVAFTATRPIAHVLGAHIEQSATPFVDYPAGTTFQPDEHVLELGRAHLLELDAAVRRMAVGAFTRVPLRDFTIVP